MRYTRHIKRRHTSLATIETGLCEQGSVITPDVKAILQQDGEEINLATVGEDDELFALEIISPDMYSVNVLRRTGELQHLWDASVKGEDLPDLPFQANEPKVGRVGDIRYAIHYQGTASFPAKLHFKPTLEEADS